MAALTIHEMKQLIMRLEEARALDEDIPQGYIDRLERAAELLQEVKSLKPIDWDNISTGDQIEHAEGLIQNRLIVINDIERHFNACGLTLKPGKKRGPKPDSDRIRQPRRSREQIEYDLRMADIIRTKKEELHLPSRGRLSEADQAKFDKEIEKELKKQKISAPRA